MAPATADPKVLKQVKGIATKALNEAAVAHAEGMGGSKNRSTATRTAYKIKADALDKIAELLGSKPKAIAATNGGAKSPARGSRSAAKATAVPRPKGQTVRATKRTGARKR